MYARPREDELAEAVVGKIRSERRNPTVEIGFAINPGLDDDHGLQVVHVRNERLQVLNPCPGMGKHRILW